jgi:C-terminal processing protease CtpA/Prc
VLRLKFHEANVGFDVSVSAFGEPLVVSKVFKGGPADVKGVEVNDLVIEINGSPVLTDHTE